MDEARIYELLGVKAFRKIVMKTEALKHRKDGKKNDNYHLKGTSIYALRSFSGYLLYNTTYHIASLVVVAIYFAVTRLSHNIWKPADIAMYALIVFNLYCIMLQRYTYIRIQELLVKKSALLDKRVGETAGRVRKVLDKRRSACPESRRAIEGQTEECALLLRIHEHEQSGTEYLLGDAEIPVLDRIADCAADIIFPNRKAFDGEATQTVFGMADPKEKTAPKKKTIARRASKLQDMLHVDKRYNVLYGFRIKAANPAGAGVCSRLFCSGGIDDVEYALDVLLAAYSEAG